MGDYLESYAAYFELPVRTGVRVERVSRVAGVRDGRPLLEDARVLDAANVVWCTGFTPGFSWIDVPVFEPSGEPRHVRGVVEESPGLYFVGLHFLYAMSSAMIHGVGRDAEHIARTIEARRSDGARPSALGSRRRMATSPVPPAS